MPKFIFGILILSITLNARAASVCSDLFISTLKLAPKERSEIVYHELNARLPGETHMDFRRGEIYRVLDGKVIGRLEYAIHPDMDLQPIVEIGVIQVDKSVRGQGLSRLLVSGLLSELPPVRSIVSEALVGSNLAAFREASLAGVPPLEAIKATPAYRMRKSLGYAEIDYRESIVNDGDALRLVVNAGPESQAPTKSSWGERVRKWWAGR